MNFIARSALNFSTKIGKALGKIGAGVAVGGLAALYIDQNIGGLREVDGPSMSPLLNKYEFTEEKFKDQNNNFGERDWHRRNDCVLFVRKFDLERGDVVILEDPKIKHSILIKRIIALPGDQVIPLGFNNVKKDPVKLLEGEVWVESDAGGFGWKDSNLFGPIRVETIKGKATYATGPSIHNWVYDWLFATRRIVSEIPAETVARVVVPTPTVTQNV